MCIGTPVQVLHCDGFRARCRDRDNGEITVDIQLLDNVTPGQWLLAQAGCAWQRLNEEQAREILAALETLERAAQGLPCDLRQGFADLLTRPPQLPEHLR